MSLPHLGARSGSRLRYLSCKLFVQVCSPSARSIRYVADLSRFRSFLQKFSPDNFPAKMSCEDVVRRNKSRGNAKVPWVGFGNKTNSFITTSHKQRAVFEG